MIWIKIILIVLSITLSGIISYFTFKDKNRRNILFGLLVLSLTTFSTKYMVTKIESFLVTEKIVEQELQKQLHYYKAIQDNDPKIYNEIITDLFKIIKNGENRENGLNKVRVKFTSIMKDRLVRASNETVLNFLETAVSEIDDLQKKNSNICFDYVKKGYVKNVNTNKIFSKKTKKLKFKLVELILKTYKKDFKLPKESEMTKLTLPIYFKLVKNHGVATLLSVKQKDSNINQKKACNLIKDLFVEVSKLDKEDSVKVTRYIISTI